MFFIFSRIFLLILLMPIKYLYNLDVWTFYLFTSNKICIFQKYLSANESQHQVIAIPLNKSFKTHASESINYVSNLMNFLEIKLLALKIFELFLKWQQILSTHIHRADSLKGAYLFYNSFRQIRGVIKK